MSKNNQNKLPNENCLQLLLEPIGTLSDSKVLTLTEDKLRQLGIENHVVHGVVWTSDGQPNPYTTFTHDEVNNILNQIKTILSAAIVNSEQRKAVEQLIERVVRERRNVMSTWVQRRIEEVRSNPEAGRGDEGLIVESKSY